VGLVGGAGRANSDRWGTHMSDAQSPSLLETPRVLWRSLIAIWIFPVFFYFGARYGGWPFWVIACLLLFFGLGRAAFLVFTKRLGLASFIVWGVLTPWFIWALLVFGRFGFHRAPAGDETLYRINARDVGWKTDVTVTEQKRTDRTSYLYIPGYRTPRFKAVDQRFAQCAFTDIAIQRKFAAWIEAPSGTEDDDHVFVGFLWTVDEDPKVLGDPRFASADAQRMEVRVTNRTCGIKIVESKE